MVNDRVLQDKPVLWSIRHDFSKYLLVENSSGPFLSKYVARFILESLPELRNLRFVDDEGSYIWHRAYLRFEDGSNVEEAMERLNNVWISTAIVQDLLVNIAKIDSNSRCPESWEWFNDSAIIADNLGSTDPNMLKATFCEYGKIRYVHVGSIHEGSTSVSAIIVYSTLVEAIASIFGMHETEFLGKKISVKLFINDKEQAILSKINAIRYKVSNKHVCDYLGNYNLPVFNHRARDNWNKMSDKIDVEDDLNHVFDDALAKGYFSIMCEQFFAGENLSSVHNEASPGDGSNHTRDKVAVVDQSNNVNDKKSATDGSSGMCGSAWARAASGRIRDCASAGNGSNRIRDKALSKDNLNGMDGETSKHKNGNKKKFEIAQRMPKESDHKSTGCTSNSTSRQVEEMTVSNNLISTDVKPISRVVNNAANPVVQITTEYWPIGEASEVSFTSRASGSMTPVLMSDPMLPGPFQQPNLGLVFPSPFQQLNQGPIFHPINTQCITLPWEQLYRRDQSTSFQTQNYSMPSNGYLMRNVNGNQNNISRHQVNFDSYEICKEMPSANRNYRQSDRLVPGTSISCTQYYFESNEACGSVFSGVGGNEACGSVFSGVGGNEACGSVFSGVGGNEACGSVFSGVGGNEACGSGSPVDWNDSFSVVLKDYVNRKQKMQKALGGKIGNDANRQNSRIVSKDSIARGHTNNVENQSAPAADLPILETEEKNSKIKSKNSMKANERRKK